MSRVVSALWTGFAVCAEVSVVADNTLVTITDNRLLQVLRLLGTLTVAENADVLDRSTERTRSRFVDGSEAVAMVFTRAF